MNTTTNQTEVTPIKWTKTFSVSHEQGRFRAFVSEHDGGHFYASLFYYQPKLGFNAMDDDRGLLDYKLKTLYGTSENEALAKLKTWTEENLPGKFQMQEQRDG